MAQTMAVSQAPGGFRPPQPQQQPMRPPGTVQQQPQAQRQVVRAAEAVPAAKRMIKKRKAPEQQLADKVGLRSREIPSYSMLEGWQSTRYCDLLGESSVQAVLQQLPYAPSASVTSN